MALSGKISARGATLTRYSPGPLVSELDIDGLVLRLEGLESSTCIRTRIEINLRPEHVTSLT